MKIAIVTITEGTNYGNRLQNYAVQKSIEELGIEVETLINKSGTESKNVSFLFKIKRKLSRIKNYLINARFKKIINDRNEAFKIFNNENINFSSIVINNDYSDNKINSIYYSFVCGSDQIWNPEFRENANANFLQFANEEKRIAFCPSFGVSEIPGNRKEEYSKYLKGFSKLSVREDDGAKIINSLTRQKAEVLIDPTMLLDAKEWDKVSKKPEQIKEGEKYILNYFLGELSDSRKSEIERIAKENNCKIINIMDKRDPFYVSGPSEFLYLEKNAFLICTDSFHSSVFAILYNRPFIIFDREQEGLQNMNSRIDTLIDKFKLKNRRFSGSITEDNLNHDYTEAYKILEKEREKSLNFLKKALDIKE